MATVVARALLLTAVGSTLVAAATAATARSRPSSAAADVPVVDRADGAGASLTTGTYTLMMEQRGNSSTASCPSTFEFALIAMPANAATGAQTVAAADTKMSGIQCTDTAFLAAQSLSAMTSAIADSLGGFSPSGQSGRELTSAVERQTQSSVNVRLVTITGNGSWCGYTAQTLGGAVALLDEAAVTAITATSSKPVSVGDLALQLGIRSSASADITMCFMVRTSVGSREGDEDECFAGSGIVELASGEAVRMDALAVGDVVRVSGGAVSPVIAFSHRKPDALTVYVRLVTASTALDVTPGHYVYVDGRLVAAGAVAVGDRLEVVSRSGGAPRLETVTRVAARVAPEGIYAPHTLSGDIVVSGVRASTYTTAVQPAVAHALLAPVRAAFAASGMDVLGGMLDGGARGGVLRFVRRLLPKGAAAY